MPLGAPTERYPRGVFVPGADQVSWGALGMRRMFTEQLGMTFS
jgi:hypothetical protein